MVDRYIWLAWVALAGLSWGVYVPVIFYGGSELGRLANARLMAILCVGIAYFVIGVLFPLAMFLTGQFQWPALKPTGLVFSGLAGVSGAVGAICVIFATQSAVGAARAQSLHPDTYRLFIAPLIFGLAPVINTVVSMFWHPEPGRPLVFGFTMPHPLLWAGIILVAVGAALVLYSKELGEEKPAPKAVESPGAITPAPVPPPTAPETRP